MIRKIFIVVLTLGALAAGLTGAVGSSQAYLDPWHFHNASDRPDLYWLHGAFDISRRWTIAINSYQRGYLSIDYKRLPTRGWYSNSDSWMLFPGLNLTTVRRRSLVPASTSVYQNAGWTVSISGFAIALLLAAHPTIAFIRGPLRRYRRRKRGLCVACGYDLRGSPGRCPECGLEDAK